MLRWSLWKTGYLKDFQSITSNYLQKKVGLELEFAPDDNFGNILNRVRDRENDVILGANIRPERLEYLGFTKSYLSNNPWVLFAESGTENINGIDELKKIKLATHKGYAQYTFLKENYPEM